LLNLEGDSSGCRLGALTRGRGSRGRGKWRAAHPEEREAEQRIRRGRGKQSRHSGRGRAEVENERERSASAGGDRDQEFDEAMPEFGTSPSSSSKIRSGSSSLAQEIVGARAVATLNRFG